MGRLVANLKCVICGGPIGTGEPVIQTTLGPAHRFKTTCEFELEAEKVRAHAIGVATDAL